MMKIVQTLALLQIYCLFFPFIFLLFLFLFYRIFLNNICHRSLDFFSFLKHIGDAHIRSASRPTHCQLTVHFNKLCLAVWPTVKINYVINFVISYYTMINDCNVTIVHNCYLFRKYSTRQNNRCLFYSKLPKVSIEQEKIRTWKTGALTKSKIWALLFQEYIQTQTLRLFSHNLHARSNLAYICKL